MAIQACAPAVGNDPFAPASQFFEELKNRLAGREALDMDHANAERLLQEQGTELLRRLYQGWLDQKAPGEAVGEVVGADGVCRPHPRLLGRRLKTIFGVVKVE